MFTKIKIKYNDEAMTNPLTAQRRAQRSTLSRSLAISAVVFLMLLMSIIYHGILLDQLDELKQFVKLESNNDEAMEAAMEMKIDSSKNIINIPDNELVTSDGIQIIEYTEIIEKNYEYNNEDLVQHDQLEFGIHQRPRRRRTSRDIDPSIDPLALNDGLDVNGDVNGDSLRQLKSKIRDKRTQVELSKLERDYTRCKKYSVNGKDCIAEYTKLYKVARDLMNILKENELVMQELTKSNDEIPSSETNKSDDDDHNDDNDDSEEKKKLDDDHKKMIMDDSSEKALYNSITESVIDEIRLNNSTPVATTTSTTPTTTSTTTTTTTTTKTTSKPHKIRPVKISWIIDGYDEPEEDILSMQNSTTSTTTDKQINEVTSSRTTTMANDNQELIIVTTTTTESTEHVPGIDDLRDQITISYGTYNTTAHLSNDDMELTTSNIIGTPTTQMSFDVVDTTALPTTPMPPFDIETIFLSSSTEPAIDDDDDEEKLRKLKFDWLVGRANFSAEEFGDDSSMDFKTSTVSSENLDEDKDQGTAATNFSAEEFGDDSSMDFKTSTVSSENLDEDKDQGTAATTAAAAGPSTTTTTTTTESHIQNIMNFSDFRAKLPDTLTHPLDYPTSVENMLESFEETDVLKPFAYDLRTNESDLYDPKLWAKKFQEASAASAAVNAQDDDLLMTFNENERENVHKMGTKANPINIKSLSAEDAHILTLCDRMAKRLRNKQIAAALESSQLAGGGRASSAGFPITGESMKATAEFGMFNPNFGVPSIPICFYLTPAHFRVPSQVVPAVWPGSTFYTMPSLYSAPSTASFVGPSIGPGSVYFMPHSLENTGNVFGGFSAASSQINAAQYMFPKAAAFQKTTPPPQQFYCTYMQNSSSNSNSGVGGSNTVGSNFKLRSNGQQSSPALSIVYASFAGTAPPSSMEELKSQVKCELPDHVACFGGNECIRESAWCDGFVECSDGSDEAACTCPNRLSSNRICDGYADCPMGEDEIGCFGCGSSMYSCYANAQEYERFNRSIASMCYSFTEKCDGKTQCLNGRDESDCNILVSDLTQHMLQSISSSEGYLYHNYRGDWYPVCNNAENWAKDACKTEGGYANASPTISSREIALKGPFIEPSHLGNVHFPQSCQQRRSVDAITDHASYVQCGQSKCGRRRKEPPKISRRLSKQQRRRRQKRIIARKSYNDEAANDDEEMEEEEKDTKDSERIVGGKYSKPSDWPFVVAIYRDGNFHCGGTIYSEHWIISAAHCAINYKKYFYEVRAGLLRRTSYSAATQIRPVSHIVVHQYYERQNMRNDLSLMRLAEPLQFNRWVKPICLPDVGRTTNGDDWIWGPEEGVLCTAVGWGAIREKGPGSDNLREVVIPIRKRCKDRPDQESESICAGDIDGGRDACQGDSGGPLFCNSVANSGEWYLAGVVSHGNGCARSGEFGVYTRVALYLDWIEMAVKPEFLPKIQPVQECPGYVCVWGGKRCIPQRKRCNRVADCLGGEDEVGCVYNFIPDVGSTQNSTTTESDYFPIDNEPTTQKSTQIQEEEEEMQSELDDDNATINEAMKMVISEKSTSFQFPKEWKVTTQMETIIAMDSTTTSTSPFTSKGITDSSKTTTDSSITTTDSSKSTTDSSMATTDNLKSTTASSMATTGLLKSKTDSSMATTDNLKSTTDYSMATTDPLKSTTASSMATTDPLKSTTDSSMATTDPLKSTTDSSMATTDPLKSTTDSSMATTDPLKSTTDSSMATTDPLKSTTDSSMATTDPLKSTTDYSMATTDPLKSTTDSSMATTTLGLKGKTEATSIKFSFHEKTTATEGKKDMPTPTTSTTAGIDFDNPTTTTTTTAATLNFMNTKAIPNSETATAAADTTTLATTTIKSADRRKLPEVKRESTLPGKFICRKISQIIELKHRCDRLVDCEDGTDEENCSCRDYLKGTLSILVCDGKTDCEDGTDEKNCGNCKTNEFLCPLSMSCIPLTKRCNEFADCPFKEDEKDCFALTNGREIRQDINKQPEFSNKGIFTRNTQGQWRTVCMDETNFNENNAKTVADICALFGFKGFTFYNTSIMINVADIRDRDRMAVPIDPDIVGQPQYKKSAAIEEHLFGVSVEPSLISIKSRLKPPPPPTPTERIHNDYCLGIYVECNAASDITSPIKTLTAGTMLMHNNMSTTEAEKLKPLLNAYSKPNVYAKPTPSDLKKLLNSSSNIIVNGNDDAAMKNISMLATNSDELHEAIEEFHWPWLVDIYANGKLWCVGVLLDKYWIMVHESCYFGVRLNVDYVVALLGGGKTKNIPHKSPNEQIRRIDCFHSVPRSDVILYHLEHPVQFTRYILPIYLPQRDTIEDYEKRECMAILHDESTGLIRTVPIREHRSNESCHASSCYRQMENVVELMKITLDTFDDNGAGAAAAARQANDEFSLFNALSKSTVCSQFGLKTPFRNIIEPIDQGILVCRDTNNDAWFPAALFSYNNTDCESFKTPFGIRSLEKLYDTIELMIDQSQCSITHDIPSCNTFRCPLGNCLSNEEICNNKADCHDGSDENAMFCVEYKKGCEPWEMKCRSSKKCIPKTKFCDHVPDCDDFTDEPTICSCFTYLKATDPAKICDGIRNCWDKSDESPVLCNCTSELFSCGSSTQECIPKDFVCDKEPDCPNGEDELYCYGIEQPLLRPANKNIPSSIDDLSKPPKYGQVIEQTYGVWHTKCFPRSSPPDLSEIRQICRKLGYNVFQQPRYRLIDDETSEVFETNETNADRFGARNVENKTLAEKYRSSTKAVVATRFSPITLNDELTILLKPSRPIAELVRWNSTDSSRCFRLEIRCA